MTWLILAVIGFATLSVFAGFLSKIENFNGLSKFFFYLLIAIMIVMLIISVVAWYTQSFEQDPMQKPNSMILTCCLYQINSCIL